MFIRSQPYEMALKCSKCKRSMVINDVFHTPALHFFHRGEGIALVRRLVLQKGKENCPSCKAEMMITRLRYGKDL